MMVSKSGLGPFYIGKDLSLFVPRSQLSFQEKSLPTFQVSRQIKQLLVSARAVCTVTKMFTLILECKALQKSKLVIFCSYGRAGWSSPTKTAVVSEKIAGVEKYLCGRRCPVLGTIQLPLQLLLMEKVLNRNLLLRAMQHQGIAGMLSCGTESRALGRALRGGRGAVQGRGADILGPGA